MWPEMIQVKPVSGATSDPCRCTVIHSFTAASSKLRGDKRWEQAAPTGPKYETGQSCRTSRYSEEPGRSKDQKCFQVLHFLLSSWSHVIYWTFPPLQTQDVPKNEGSTASSGTQLTYRGKEGGAERWFYSSLAAQVG